MKFSRGLLLISLTCYGMGYIGFCANVLIMHPIYAGSHHFALKTFAKYLVDERGHNVTMIKFAQVNDKPLEDKSLRVINLPILDEDNRCHKFVNDKGKVDF